MPLVKRAVEPASLCRNKIPDSVSSELECVTNNTLSGESESSKKSCKAN